MKLTVWTYEGPPHVGAMRVATGMKKLHYVLHAPQGDTYADLLFTMIERRDHRPPVTYTTFQARDLGLLSANWWANIIWQKSNMEEKVQGSIFNRWQNSLPQPYRFIFKTTFFIVAMYLIEMYFNLIGYSILPWRWF